MAISESSLHPYIKGLVEENGKLTVTELNKLLREILVLDTDDLTLLSGRRDDKFSQIVRNVVAHAPDGVSDRFGYILDKTKRPAVFYAKELDVATARSTVLSAANIKKRRARHHTFKAKKVDHALLNAEHSALGDEGENFALEWERNRLRALNVDFNVLDEVIHFSRKYGDGAGYDILSREGPGYELRYIEVKTTKGGMDTPFFMSANERAFLEIYSDCAYIYRVFHYDLETNMGEVEILSYDDVINNYIFDPVTYKVSRKP